MSRVTGSLADQQPIEREFPSSLPHIAELAARFAPAGQERDVPNMRGRIDPRMRFAGNFSNSPQNLRRPEDAASKARPKRMWPLLCFGLALASAGLLGGYVATNSANLPSWDSLPTRTAANASEAATDPIDLAPSAKPSVVTVVMPLPLPPEPVVQVAAVVAAPATESQAAIPTPTQTRFALSPQHSPVIRPEEAARARALIAHGRKMVQVGYLAGARAYFQRAAEAGSAEAAAALASTYDAGSLTAMHVQGIRPDADQAKVWQERAQELRQVTPTH